MSRSSTIRATSGTGSASSRNSPGRPHHVVIARSLRGRRSNESASANRGATAKPNRGLHAGFPRSMSRIPMTVPPHSDGASDSIESMDSAILSVLMDNVPDRIYFKDLEIRFVRNNAAHAKSLGASSPEECVGKTDFDFFSREHAERALADERQIIETGKPIIAKIERLTMRNGRQGWASSTKMPWKDAQGRTIGTFGLTRDVTASKD